MLNTCQKFKENLNRLEETIADQGFQLMIILPHYHSCMFIITN
jgi:hypothetical protein